MSVLDSCRGSFEANEMKAGLTTSADGHLFQAGEGQVTLSDHPGHQWLEHSAHMLSVLIT